MRKILAIHGVSNKPTEWEAGFKSLEQYGQVTYLQWPSSTVTWDYCKFILFSSYRERILATVHKQLDKIKTEFDLVVTHSFGQVVFDMLVAERTDNYAHLVQQANLRVTPVINLGGPFSNPLIGIPLRQYMTQWTRMRTVVINKSDNIPTAAGRYQHIPHQHEIVFDVDRVGEDHAVEIYLANEEAQKAIKAALDTTD